MSDQEIKKKVDEDWKRKVQEDKLKLDGREATGQQNLRTHEGHHEQGQDDIAERNFSSFVASLATQALIHLGAMPHPVTQKAEVSPEQTKEIIDILQMLQEKTHGNLTPPEANHLENILHQLRLAYVKLVQSSKPGQEPPL